MPKQQAALLTAAQVGALAGISTSAVSKARHADDPLHREAGGYDPATVGRWLARRTLASAGKTEGDALDLAHEQALLARARRLELEREARVAEGKLIDRALALETYCRAARTIRDAILSVPGRIAAMLVGIDDERIIDRMLTDALREELHRVAQMGGCGE